MQDWQQFLEEQGYRFDPAAASGAPTASPALLPAQAAAGFIAPLTDLGLMAFSGDDAAGFLHSQLTNDVEHLGQQEARLAAYCSPKGRMLASLLYWRAADGAILVQVPRELQAAVQKRLQMYILRAKVKAADTSAAKVALGLGGAAAGATLTPWFATLPDAPYAKVDGDAGCLIRMADAFGAPRYQWLATPEQAAQAWPQLAQALAPAGAELWRLADIQAGVPRIVQATQEKFVPQMVNFELIGGVSFKKGCYPGQEIVARSQYLGKLKRRTLAATLAGDTDTAPAPVAAGMEVYAEGAPDQPCGMVVNAERAGAGEFALLVELQTAAAEAGAIRLGSAAGPTLQFQPLPYALPDPS